jgi:DNA-binding transcriptional MerR regulator
MSWVMLRTLRSDTVSRSSEQDGMLIGELSRRSGVSPRSLRYYEQQGLISARRGGNGYREYGEAAVTRAATIQSLFGMGFPRDVVEAVLGCSGPATPAAHDQAADALARVRDEMDARIGLLTQTREAIDEFLTARRPPA